MTTGSTSTPQGKGSPDLKAIVRKQGQKLNLVDRNNLFASIDQAVLEAVGSHVDGVDEALLQKITLAARQGIVARLKSSSKSIRGVPQSAFLKDVMAARRHLTKERDKLAQEMEMMQAALHVRRENFAERHQELARETQEQGMVQDQALVDQINMIFAGLVAQNPELAAIQDQVTSLALLGMQQERQKLLDSKVDEHKSQVEQFERRIAKLSQSLETTEGELKRIAAMKGVDDGVASIYRTVQGLSDGSDNAESKREMLAVLFEANMELKNQLAGSR
jgi:hypothetical protein